MGGNQTSANYAEFEDTKRPGESPILNNVLAKRKDFVFPPPRTMLQEFMYCVVEDIIERQQIFMENYLFWAQER
jgi:hypothetical protein